ncbi:dephospho-CoA kinase [Pontibacillus yanchengensis]|uniref:Dephospho-CoA kinase n=1 Tax=Pontibacillus yanchengensis Y32 TaxID=1385514 RepID=A0A0A2TBB8_9BACI|nr:dephospho-CoA kinase [Pontibacillus yanchengensis]KGP71723.1 dephospho-CoA kinase [Pontibacillus yanchengensis Y32]
MTVVIGLTGSIASGKSTVSLMFDEFNIPVVDADKLSRKVVEPGKKAYNQIIEEFGHDILRDDQTIDRKALGTIVFNDEEKRKKLNSFVHPAVREEMVQQRDFYVTEGYKAVVLDIPLLFESDLAHYVDKVVVVYVDEDTQLKRLMERDKSTKEDALSRINSQMPVSQKAKKADEVVDNSGSKHDSYKQLETILRQWKII